MNRHFVGSLLLIVAVTAAQGAEAPPATRPAPPTPKDPVLVGAQVNHGLCVVLGADNAASLVSLTNQGWIVVHALSLDAGVVAKVRSGVAEAKADGLVTIEQVRSYAQLPYQANMVNLLVADLDALGDKAPAESEVLRVIEPIHGVAYLKKGGQWARRTKALPKEMDEWTHFNHDATNNPVSKDSLVGPMRGVQWTAHIEGGANSNIGVLLAGGRWFASYDPKSAVPRADEFGERIDARDAFNGMLQWRRFTGIASRLNHEASVCTDGRRLYGYLAKDGVGRAWDAATGAEQTVYSAGLTKEFRKAPAPQTSFFHSLSDGVLVQAMNEKVVAIDTATDKVLWTHTQNGQSPQDNALAIQHGRVLVAFAPHARPFLGYGHMHSEIGTIVCLDLKTGQEKWRTDAFAGTRTANFIAYKDLLVIEDFRFPGRGLEALHGMFVIDAATGKQVRHLVFDPPPKQALHGTFAVFNDMYEPMSAGPCATWNVLTGEAGPTLNAVRYNWCGFTRWTAKGLLPHASGFLDRATGQFYASFAARSACDMGRFPAYGLVYSQTFWCACIPRLRGFTALHSVKQDWTPVEDARRLETGDGAPGVAPAAGAWPKPDEWPIMLGNVKRGGAIAGQLGENLNLLKTIKPATAYPDSPVGTEWREDRSLLGDITPPTVADGLLFVAASDAHRLDAFDAATGEPKWCYTIGARIDSPPTIYGGLAIFGGRDGYVYALNVKDGKLVWRFLAAPAQRNIVASSQVESLWPVVGSLLILDGRLLVTAGRQSESDGGIFLWVLDPLTGKVLAKRTMDDNYTSDKRFPIGRRGRVEDDPLDKRNYVNEVMSSDGTLAYLGPVAIHPPTAHWSTNFRDGGYSVAGTLHPFPPEVKGFGEDYWGMHLSAPKWGFLARSTGSSFSAKKGDGWCYGLTTSYGGPLAHRWIIRDGQLYASRGTSGPLAKLALDDKGRPADPGKPGVYSKEGKLTEIGNIPLKYVAAMAAGGDRIVLAGEVGQPNYKPNTPGLVVMDFSGKVLQQLALPAFPIDNGLAIAYGRVYLTLGDGTVAVLGSPATH